ncbi:MAG: protoporphyrinogen oxidase HemJ [Bauldia sp.]|nr:protoporphyrinogen oxidase HemJ [Bauldia sp.]
MSEYNWQQVLVSFHVVFMVAWMAGIFYLPRLFVYHAGAERGSDKSETFKVMERKLLRGIMNPSMVITLVTGIALAFWKGMYDDPWLMAKAALVLVLVGVHFWLIARQRDFAADRNTRASRTYRIVNEAPVLLLLGIVILVIVKPF